MKCSEAGLDLIRKFEGCQLEAYQDSVGIWTVGVGHTGPDVTPGMQITQAQANALLVDDIHAAEDCIDAFVFQDLTQGQHDACVSFIFNLGCKAFRGSTLLTLINAGKFDEAAGQFQRWNKAGQKVLAGLVRRRAAEAELFQA